MPVVALETKTERKRFFDLTKEEMETSLAIATKQAQDELHAKELPYAIGDSEGIYDVYPDGSRVFTPYKH